MMLDKVKLALRKTAAVFNDEIEDYIALIFGLSVSTFRKMRDRPAKRWAILF